MVDDRLQIIDPEQGMDLRIKPTTVQKQTVEKLREAIVSGVFKPGRRLVEAELCNVLGVSRPSVREALRALEAERLIANIPMQGNMVPVVPWEEAAQIYHVRLLLEGEAAALCARNHKPPHIREMQAALDGFAEAVARHHRSELLKTTGRFYDAMLNGCGNQIIADLLRGLVARISFLRDRSMSRTGRAQYSLQEMRAILRAIEDGNSKAARTAAQTHVKRASAAARRAFTEV
jgi:GntR family transcriptional regulator, trigonelline degradation regulator